MTTFARLHGFTRDEAKVEAERVLDFRQPEGRDAHSNRALFEGHEAAGENRARLGQRPDLIVLDEPLTGCDPGTDHIMNVVRSLAEWAARSWSAATS